MAARESSSLSIIYKDSKRPITKTNYLIAGFRPVSAAVPDLPNYACTLIILLVETMLALKYVFHIYTQGTVTSQRGVHSI